MLEFFPTWKVPIAPREVLAAADVIVGFAFGRRANHPGPGNITLALAAESLYQNFRKPLILQSEISCACHAPHVSIEGHPNGKTKCSYDMLSEANAICQERRWRRVVILSHPILLWRYMLMAERLGLKSCPAVVEGIPFDRRSIDRHTRSFLALVCREMAIRRKLRRHAYS